MPLIALCPSGYILGNSIVSSAVHSMIYNSSLQVHVSHVAYLSQMFLAVHEMFLVHVLYSILGSGVDMVVVPVCAFASHAQGDFTLGL